MYLFWTPRSLIEQGPLIWQLYMRAQTLHQRSSACLRSSPLPLRLLASLAARPFEICFFPHRAHAGARAIQARLGCSWACAKRCEVAQGCLGRPADVVATFGRPSSA